MVPQAGEGAPRGLAVLAEGQEVVYMRQGNADHPVALVEVAGRGLDHGGHRAGPGASVIPPPRFSLFRSSVFLFLLQDTLLLRSRLEVQWHRALGHQI